MWRCTVCQHVAFGDEPPDVCPVCGAPKDKFVPYESDKIKGPKTFKNIKDAFIGETQAHQRNLAFARRAEQEQLPQIAHLFRAVAEAEAIHAFRYFDRLGMVRDTQENLNAAFERENLASINIYPQLIKDANEEGSESIANTFSQARDVEKGHAKLYEKALQHMLAEKGTEYNVCQVCGYVADGQVPDECPICGAKKEMFKKVL